MANQWYDKTKTTIGKGNLDLSSLSDPRMIAVKSGYVFSQGHDFLDDIDSGDRLDTIALANVTFSVSLEAYLDADDPIYLSPPVGTVVAFVIYNDTGTENTSPLILFIDSGVTLPITTESSRELKVIFNSNGIAKL